MWALASLSFVENGGAASTYWVESHSDDAWVLVSGVGAGSSFPFNLRVSGGYSRYWIW